MLIDTSNSIVGAGISTYAATYSELLIKAQLVSKIAEMIQVMAAY